MSDTNIVSMGGLLPRDLLDRIGSSGDVTLGGLDPTDYHLVPGERIRDAITRSWNRLVGVWGSFRRAEVNLSSSDQTATSLTRERWLRPLLEELGFHDLPLARGLAIDGTEYPISHQQDTSVPIHLLGCRIKVDRRTPGVRGAAKISPHGLVQEFLNRSDDHLWGMVSNGFVLRILRDNVSLTRPAYCEFDLAAIFDGGSYNDFVQLWLVAHRSRFEGDPPEQCFLEQWTNQAASEGTRALDRLREGVEKAIESLGEGFLAHRHNATLRSALREGDLSGDDYLRQLLRLVYRLLFLLVAESRDLLLSPDTDQIARCRYKKFYSVQRLRTLADRRLGTAHDDLWQGLRITMNALDAGGEGVPELGLVPLGSFLWSPEAIPDLADSSIDNRHLLKVVRNLALVKDYEARMHRLVDYRNLGSSELGSVYESLLELHPEINLEGGGFGLATAGGSERKTTGSYYTPTSLINQILDDSLDPILDRAEASDHPEQALLDLRVLDPACGSGHFLVAAGHRIAGRLARVRSGGIEPAPPELREALRQVVGRCLYGIDINPMAVELCKVSLWMEANDRGRPLEFLDHHIVCGNSLLGTTPDLLEEGLPNEAFKALTGDDKKWVTKLRKTNRMELRQRDQGILDLGYSVYDSVQALAEEMAILDPVSGESAEDVAAKSEIYADLQRSDTYQIPKLAADAWCAAFVTPKRPGEPVITDSTVRAIGEGQEVEGAVVERVKELAEEYQFLHLHLAFPDVQEQYQGFDAVLGNPPWDQIQYDPRETFAVSHPDIAGARTMAIRNQLIADLAEDEPETYARYLLDVRHLKGIKHFLHASGRYPLGSVGRLNTAPLFLELMWHGINPKGRVGVIVPSGIATDSFTQKFFRALTNQQALASLYDFENRKGIFPGVHRGYKFCLLNISGSDHPVPSAEFAFFLYKAEDLADPLRRYPLAQTDFALFNPNTRTCPTFRTRRDKEISAKMYQRAGVLWQEERENQTEENPWGVSFQLMFMMNTDSGLFRTRDQLESDGWEMHGNIFTQADQTYLPLYEAKLFHQYDHRFATFEGVSTHDLVNGNARPLTPEERADPEAVVVPRYWVPVNEVIQRTTVTRERERFVHSGSWLATCSPRCHQLHQRTYRDSCHDPNLRPRPHRIHNLGWWLGFRVITTSTNERTSICSIIPGVGVSETSPLLYLDPGRWLQVFRDVTNSMNERTVLSGLLPEIGVGNNAPVMDYETARAIAGTLVMANMNSLPLDWAARLSVGGTHMNFFIIKQLPILPPEAYLDSPSPGQPSYAQIIAPKVLELTFTAWE
ncbi:MAG: N-6 DNA methylase, partial [bacterium]|nr:N-6 DNA methylase [bacterium]